jgi:TetR/AcrR family transcriptional regulator, transcriptional repressor for nem operon
MARVVKEEEYSIRRNEILDVVKTLVYTKGFEQMTIQDILDRLKISKGAFYHYFDSKLDLLDSLIERMMDEVLQIINPIIDDPNLKAIEKFRRYFDTAARWKTDQKELMLGLMRVWYQDDNAIVRQKMFASAIDRMAPAFAKIIQQGIQEGVFNSTHPDQISQVIWSLFTAMGDTIANLMLSDDPQCRNIHRLESTIAVYSDALERVLGAPTGSLIFVDYTTLQEWLPPPQDSPSDNH